MIKNFPFNPHVWGLFLQGCEREEGGAPLQADFQSPCLGTLFAREDAVVRRPQMEERLSIPMSGDSFCKYSCQLAGGDGCRVFQSPCLGTLFARRVGVMIQHPEVWDFQSPCLGTLFASYQAEFEEDFHLSSFQSPCLGTLFARLMRHDCYVLKA